MKSVRTVLLMRHAKSSWDDADLDDHVRPLNKRGRRDAPRMGRFLVEQELAPELLITSSAKRARQTAELVAEECGGPQVIIEDRLYMADPNDWREVLAEAPLVSRLLLVGHNPGLEELVSSVAGQFVRIPTATIARVHCPDAALENWTLEGIWRPKELFST